jgi:uncharacterized membrane protein (UPF0127 family)
MGATRLVVDGRDVAPVEIATSGRARRRGLLGRSGLTGAFVLRPAASVHTFGMRFAIDVACCDRSGVVVAVRTLPPGRVTRPRPLARTVIEAEAGAFARWGLAVGSTVRVAP